MISGRPLAGKIIIFTVACAVFAFIVCCGNSFAASVNMKFIDSRMGEINAPGAKGLTIWHTTDKEIKDAGYTASTAEIALVIRAYIKHYQLFNRPEDIGRALKGIEFLRYMQDKNGLFYRYIKENGEKNKETPDLGDTTAQAFLALCDAYRVLKKESPGEAQRVEELILRTYKSVKDSSKSPEHSYGTYKTFEKMNIPRWLIMDRGDLSSMYLLGMSRYCEATANYEMSEYVKILAQGIIEFKNSELGVFPPFAHLIYSDSPSLWKTENALAAAALAEGSQTFSNSAWLKDAEKEGIGFLAHSALTGPIAGYFPHPSPYPQTPLATLSLVENFTSLYRVTQDEKYLVLAGICTSWFFKNNPAAQPVYSSDDGSCFKMIEKSGINKDKSLTASACAVLSLMEIYKTKGFDLLSYKVDLTHTYQIFESEEGKPVNTDFEVADWDYAHGQKGRVVIIRRKNTFWHKFKLDFEDEYFLLIAFQKQQMYSASVAVNVRVDGGPILLVPLAGATVEPFMMMQKVTDPIAMYPGLHTVGVRYKGLLFKLPAIIDCAVLQPVLERVQLSGAHGQHILLVKNWSPEKKKMKVPEDAAKRDVEMGVTSINGNSHQERIFEHKGKSYVNVPPEGIGVIEW